MIRFLLDRTAYVRGLHASIEALRQSVVIYDAQLRKAEHQSETRAIKAMIYGQALRRITNSETAGANGTVRRMARIAKDALK